MKNSMYILALLLLVGCENQSSTFSTESNAKDFAMGDDLIFEEEAIEIPMTKEPPAPPQMDPINAGMKIIKNGNMSIKTDSLGLAKSRLDMLIKEVGAYYSKEDYYGDDYKKSFSLSIRVPANRFELLLKKIESGNGEIINKNISARDVTSEYIDIELRLENNRAYVTQYQSLLAKAKTIKEILEVKEELRRLESKINSQTGRLKYLNDKVRYSTLDLQLSQEIEYKPIIAQGPSFLERIGKSMKFGFEGLQSFILMIIGVWPIYIIGGVVYFGIRFYLASRK